MVTMIRWERITNTLKEYYQFKRKGWSIDKDDWLIVEKNYEKKNGLVYPAPYVTILLSTKGYNLDPFIADARIDTGADFSCVPVEYARKLGPLIMAKPVNVRGYSGEIKRVCTYRIEITILGYPCNAKKRIFHLDRGVLLTDSNIILLGMDILKDCRKVIFDNDSEAFSIAC